MTLIVIVLVGLYLGGKLTDIADKIEEIANKKRK